jgi:hypothetical protein
MVAHGLSTPKNSNTLRALPRGVLCFVDRGKTSGVAAVAALARKVVSCAAKTLAEENTTMSRNNVYCLDHALQNVSCSTSASYHTPMIVYIPHMTK